ncbi:DUF423 domain-containing protein [Paenilisteria rocourtiae]|uniref:Uncharacterized membrane protein YgdD (TMEM256/DUF423 family) n=1 Tax=Listeria rocourtiae TaxID=647910 RepID=A0A4R6ZSL5_9LIST|nr:DUF423 domain-containing protein [Listeria rocourtiae]EUJ47156.1 hypothetical protein PROCOU_09991 [Listeria rocourtiae FSL F6-920]MBC1436072.1 DUF423 domain-containing protein [Listeria rocourtiae]MBC1605189.1 DUF423 domain-containing protein [Listeria rocourtiae]TDR55700.1 uncharacterized membrane protein YgdD (TMEM256/DUF423 family) [Listeria rocourtiae]
MRKMLIIGAIFAGLAVGIGAFGAHALKEILGSYHTTFETGVQYQMFHATAILIVGLLLGKINSGLLRTAGYLFGTGIILFSGSLYVLSITKITILGAVTPLGGVAFITGWICFIIAVAKYKPVL